MSVSVYAESDANPEVRLISETSDSVAARAALLADAHDVVDRFLARGPRETAVTGVDMPAVSDTAIRAQLAHWRGDLAEADLEARRTLGSLDGLAPTSLNRRMPLGRASGAGGDSPRTLAPTRGRGRARAARASRREQDGPGRAAHRNRPAESPVGGRRSVCRRSRAGGDRRHGGRARMAALGGARLPRRRRGRPRALDRHRAPRPRSGVGRCHGPRPRSDRARHRGGREPARRPPCRSRCGPRVHAGEGSIWRARQSNWERHCAARVDRAMRASAWRTAQTSRTAAARRHSALAHEPNSCRQAHGRETLPSAVLVH